jgi:hypothetical protein
MDTPKKYNITPELIADFNATLDAKPNLSSAEILSKFPELNNDLGFLQSMSDYRATAKSGKYKTPEELNSKFPEFSFDVKKKDLSQSGSTVGSKPSQDTNVGVPFAKTNNASPFDYTNPDYNSQVQKKAIEDKAIFEKGKQVVAPYKQKNDQFNAITPSAVHTKRYRAADGDIAEIEDPQSYLSNAYTSAAWNQIPSTVTSLLDKNPTQKLALVKEISENPELRQKLTKFGSVMSQAEYLSTIKVVLEKEANKRNEKFKALEASGMQEKLNKASAIVQVAKGLTDELKAVDTNLNFIKNTTADSAGYKALTDGIKTKKKEIDLYLPEVLSINKLSQEIKSQESGFETKYGQYKDPSTGRFLIKDEATADAFNSDVAKLQESYNIYNQKIKSPEYKKYTEDVSVYNDFIAKQEKANEPILKANQQFNATLKKREILVGKISALSNELKQYDAEDKNLSEWKKLANENKEYSFLIGDKVLSGALLQRLPQEYSRELSKLSKEIDNINSGAFIMPTTEFTGRLLSSTVDMFYKMGGNALGIIGDINQEYQDLIGAGNKKDYTWFDWERDKSLDFMQTNGPQFIDRPAIDPKTGDIVWSNIPYVAASSSGSMLGNILIGAVTGGSSTALVATTYLSTIGDRYKEADQMGLTGEQSFVYANSLAMLEGLSELIMPDYDLFKGLQKAGLAEFIKSGKGLTVKAAIDYSFKHGLKDIPKEIVEEYIVNAGEILNKSAILLADGKFNKDTFVNTLGNPKDYAVTALTTALIPAGMKALTVTGQGRTMYNNIMYDASRNLSASQQAISNLVDAKQLTEAQADQINKDLIRYSAVNSVLPQDIIAEKAVVVTPLMEQVQRLKAKHAESAVDVVKSTYEAQIRELNNKIQEVLLKPNSEFMTPSQVEEVRNELSIEDTDALNAKKEELKLKLTQPIESAAIDIVAPAEDIDTKNGKKLFSEPAEDVSRVASEYKKQSGIESNPGEKIFEIDVEEAKKRADAFDEMKHEPDNPEVKAAYEAMAKETIDQFSALEGNDYKVEIYEGKGEPYKSSQEMLKDLRENKHLFILSTENDFGETPITEEQRQESPLLRDSGKKDINGKPLLVNDVFRFVHDVFGHGERGNSFGAKGEENAWDVHSRMYSPIARKAMTTETRGQNSWVNFGKHMRNPDGSIKKKGDEGYMDPKQRPYADQKIGLLPDFAYKLYFEEKAPTTKEESVGEYDPSEEIKDKDMAVLNEVLVNKKINPENEPEVTDFGDRVVFEYYDEKSDSNTRITFLRNSDGEIIKKGVEVKKNTGRIRGSKSFEDFVNSKSQPNPTETTNRDAEWDKKTKQALPKSNFANKAIFFKNLKSGVWGMLTGENPDKSQLSDEENAIQNEKAKAWLKNKGYNPQPIFGKYDNSENSFFVKNLSRKDAEAFAEEFKQESIATNEGLIYRDGRFEPVVPGSAAIGAQDNYYSSINIGGEVVDFSIQYAIKDTTAEEPVKEEAKKEEENPLISGLKKVNQLLKGMQDEKRAESSKVTIVEPKKVQKVSKDEKELARINEDIAFAEGTIEQNLVDIENKEEELQNEKGHRDYDVKELQQKIAEVRKKKMPKDEKEDEIESIRYDIEERKDDYDVMYEEEMANIKEMKAENKKLEKKLITLKLKQEDYASKIKPEQEQESPKQDDKPKRERTKSTRKQTEEPKTDSGDSDISGKKGKKITDINAKFVKVSELYEKVRSAKNQTEKTTANRKLSALLNLNPTVKYIFENMNELQKQLGDRLKKNSFCP